MGKPVASDDLVSARILSMWLACSRAYISELEARKILGREGGKFPLRINA
jgi:hypothetical protein